MLESIDKVAFVDVCRYKPGDVAMIHPENVEERVEEFLNHMGLDGSRLFLIQQNDPSKTECACAYVHAQV